MSLVDSQSIAIVVHQGLHWSAGVHPVMLVRTLQVEGDLLKIATADGFFSNTFELRFRSIGFIKIVFKIGDRIFLVT